MNNPITNEQRTQWIKTDDSLSRWWQSTGASIRQFIARNRVDIDLHIRTLQRNFPNTSPLAN